jgi:hypothetical protein
MLDPTGGLKVLGDALLAYLGPLVAASALAMALIEAAKKLLSLRGRFHRRAVRRWLAEHPENLPDEGERAWARLNPLAWLHGAGHYVRADAPVAAGNDAAGMALRQGTAQRYAELVTLTSGLPQAAALPGDGRARRFRGIDRALFELETARMMSQLQDSADAVLGQPVALAAAVQPSSRAAAPREDVLDWQQGEAAGQAERYARIKLSVRRQLDGFQSVTQLRWDDLNQLWAVVLGAVILFVAQVLALSAAELVQLRGTAGLLQVLADGLAALTRGARRRGGAAHGGGAGGAGAWPMPRRCCRRPTCCRPPGSTGCAALRTVQPAGGLAGRGAEGGAGWRAGADRQGPGQRHRQRAEEQVSAACRA